MNASVIILTYCASLGGIHGEFARLFERCEFQYTGGVYVHETFRYRFYTPDIRPGHRYPILVWLHGRGEAGSDNTSILKWLDGLVMPAPWDRENYPFYVLAVQCPQDNRVWNSAPEGTPPDDAEGSDMVSVTHAILNSLLDQHPIDRDRIYLSGVSSGGYGSWVYAMRHPGLFAAVAPLAAAGISDRQLEQLLNVPVWVFHSTGDKKTPVAGARRTVKRLREAGGHVRLTEIDSTAHDCWSAAFGRHELLRWLLAQRRGGSIYIHVPKSLFERVADAFKGWTARQLFGQALFIGVTGAAVWWTARWIGELRAQFKNYRLKYDE